MPRTGASRWSPGSPPEKRAGALVRPACEFDGAIDNRPERVGLRHFEVVDLHLGKIGVELFLAVARCDPVVKRLGVSEELALVAIGWQVPGVEHDLNDLADPACLVGHPLPPPLLYYDKMFFSRFQLQKNEPKPLKPLARVQN